MAKTKYDKITRFDKGIRNSSRLVSDGAFEMVKGFDIFSDPLKAIPTPGWSSELSADEKKLGLKSIEASGETLYACGKAVTTWIGPNWEYRVRITAAGDTAKMHYFDLANMPTSFWDNATGLTVTDAVSHIEQPFYLGNFDADAQTGFIFVERSTDLYIYYGADAGPNSNATLEDISSGFEVAAWLENNNNNSGTSLDFDDGPGGTYTTGSKTEYALDSGIYSDPTLFVSGDDCTFVMMFTTGATVPTTQNLIFFGGFDITIAASALVVDIDCTSTHVALNSSTLQPNTQYLMVIKVIETSGPTTEGELFLNKVSADTDSQSGNLDLYSNQNHITASSDIKIDFVQFWNDDITTTIADAIHDMWMDNANFWTVGSEETYSSITPEYDGLAIWERDISGGDWTILSGYGGTAVDLTREPTYSKQLMAGSDVYFVHLEPNLSNKIAYYGAYSTFNGMQTRIDNNLITIGSGLPMMAQPEDKQSYLSFGSDIYQLTSTTMSEESLNTFSTVQSMNNFIDSLAFISTYRDKAWVEYWNLNDAESDQVFDLGRGKGRVVANIGGTLMAVVNNFIDDDNKSGTRKSMDVRKLNGLDFSTHVSLDTPGSMDGYYTNSWDQPVGQHTAIINNFTTLFYAKLPTNAEATEFNEGLWSLSKNQVTDEISLALYVETPGKNVNYLTSVGNIPYIIHSDDGSMDSQTGIYDLTSEIVTKVFNGRDESSRGDSELKKKLVGVQITHENLDDGQIISLYFRKDGDTEWTKVGENTTADSLAKEYTNITSTGGALPIYQEIQYKVESTGGSSAITGLKARYEELTDNYA